MNRHFHRLVCLLLGPVLICADPVFSHAVSGMLDHSKHTADFENQALTPRSTIPTWGPDKMGRRIFVRKIGQALTTFAITTSLVPLSTLAQKSKPKKEKVPPLVIIQAAQIEKQNIALTQDKLEKALAFPFETADANDLEKLLPLVLRQNPTVWGDFLEYRAAWEKLLAMTESENKYFTLHPDQYHSTGVGNRPYFRDTIVYPGVAVGNPLHAFELAEVSPGNPGFWGTIVSGFRDAFERIWGGVQWKSSSIIQEDWLQIHGQALAVRKAFAAFEGSTQEKFKESVLTWFDFHKQAIMVDELAQESAIASRATRRASRGAVANASADPQKLFELKSAAQKANQDFQKAVAARESLRIHFAETIVPSQKELMETFAPHFTPVTVDRTMLEKASQVQDLLRSERFSEPSADPTPLPGPQEYKDALRAHFSGNASKVTQASDLFASDGDASFHTLFNNLDLPPIETPATAETVTEPAQAPVLGLPTIDDLFIPLAIDEPLTPSPRERLWELQKAMLQEIHEKTLRLEEKTKLQAGVHLDIGTLPLIAEVLNFDIQKPTRSTIFSLEDLIHESELQTRSIDEQIEAERIRVRAAFLDARVRRQSALKNYLAVSSSIATKAKALNAALKADSRYVAADYVTPYLEIQLLRKTASRHLLEAMQALYEARFYMSPAQQAIDEEFIAFNLEVAQRLDPASTLTPEQLNPPTLKTNPKDISKKLIGAGKFIFLAATTLALSSITQAHTFMMSSLPRSTDGTLDVTLARGDTPWKIAREILRVQNPAENPSIRSIARLAQQMSRENHFDPRHIPTGATLHVGQFNADVVHQLVPEARQVPHLVSAHFITAAAAPPTPPMVIPHAMPIEPVTPLHASILTPWEHLHIAVHHVFNWMVSSPEHMVWVGGIGALVGVIIYFVGFHRKFGHGFGAMYPSSPSSRIRLIPGWIVGGLMLVALASMAAFPLSWLGLFHLTMIQSPYLLATAAMLVSAAVLLFLPRLWQLPLIGQLYAPGAAAFVTSFVLFPLHFLALPVFLVLWYLFHAYMNKESMDPTNLIGRMSRNRRTFLALLAPALLLLASHVYPGVAQRVGHFMGKRRDVLRRTDVRAPNFGRQSQTDENPRHLVCAAGEGGVVTAVNESKLAFHKEDLIIGYEPLDQGILDRLIAVNAAWKKATGKDLVPPESIQSAATTPDGALLTIQTHLSSGSVDDRIADLLTNKIEQSLIEYRETEGHSQAVADATEVGDTKVPPLQLEKSQYLMEALGIQMHSLLVERAERNIVAARDFEIFPDAGIIPRGTDIPNNGPVRLFVQDVPNDSFLQIRMTPADVRAFLQRLHRPEGAKIRLSRQNGTVAQDISLTDIVELVRPDDAGFTELLKVEDFSGQAVVDRTIGTSPTITVNMIVRRQVDEAPYFFEGIFDENGQRVIGDSSGVAIGEVTLLQDNTAGPPHLYALKPLEAKQSGTRALLSRYDALLKKADEYRHDYPESLWALEFVNDCEKEIKSLQGELVKREAQMDVLEKAGLANPLQAEFPYRNSHYIFDRLFPNAPSEEAFLELGDNKMVTLRLSFYANANTLPVGSVVKAQASPNGPMLNFRITNYESLDRNNDLGHYIAEATVAWNEAVQVFPPDRPVTFTYVEVPLQGNIASRLTQRELLKAFFLTAASSLAMAFFPHPDSFKWPWAGFGLAILLHELGHGWRAWRQGRMAYPTWDKGIVWKENRFRWGRRHIIDDDVRAAGPVASEWAYRGAAFVFGLQILWGLDPHWIWLFIPLALSSAIFRMADLPWLRSTEAVTDSVTIPVEDEANFPGSTPEPALVGLPHTQMTDRGRVANPLGETELHVLAQSLENTVLEYETEWHAGDDATYVAWWQAPWLWTNRKIKLTDRMIFWRRYRRDNVNWLDATLLDAAYKSKRDEATASSKTRTYQWVLVFLFGIVGYLTLFAPQSVVQTVNRLLFSNIMLQNLQGTELGTITTYAIMIFIIGGLIFTLTEGWGKFWATSGWNIRHIGWKMAGIFIDPEQDFKMRTGKDALNVFHRIDTARILHPRTKEYDEFLDHFARFARHITDKAYAHFPIESPDENNEERPSKEALAIANAFRIQIHRSAQSRSPIYHGTAPELSDDLALFAFLRTEYPNFDEFSSERKNWLLQCARVYEVKLRMRDYPVHTLMSLLRSGLAELVIDMDNTINADERGVEMQILDDIKERASTLDPDVFDGLRAQDRFDEFSDMLHYVFEGLGDAVHYRDERKLERILNYMEGAVTPPERPTWDEFKSQIHALMNDVREDSKEEKSGEQMARENIVQSIAYVLTLRRLKENAPASLEFLRGLRSAKIQPANVTMQHRYLRNTDGQPTTSILKLNMAYQKYYDLLTDLIKLFPNQPLFEKNDIYITFNNTIGLRQTLREIEYYLRLTRGRVIIVDDLGRTHRKFSLLLERNLRERLPWHLFHRVRVTTMARERRALDRNPSAIIISSAIPLDWKYLEKSAGTLAHVPSPLLNPAAVFVLLSTLKKRTTEALFRSRRASLAKEYNELDESIQNLNKRLKKRDQLLLLYGNQLLREAKLKLSFLQTLQEWQLMLRYLILSNLSTYDHKRYARLKEMRDKRLKQIRSLGDLQREINGIGDFMTTIRVPFKTYQDDEDVHSVDPDKVLTGEFSLEFFIRNAKRASPIDRQNMSPSPRAARTSA